MIQSVDASHISPLSHSRVHSDASLKGSKYNQRGCGDVIGQFIIWPSRQNGWLFAHVVVFSRRAEEDKNSPLVYPVESKTKIFREKYQGPEVYFWDLQ